MVLIFDREALILRMVEPGVKIPRLSEGAVVNGNEEDWDWDEPDLETEKLTGFVDPEPKGLPLKNLQVSGEFRRVGEKDGICYFLFSEKALSNPGSCRGGELDWPIELEQQARRKGVELIYLMHRKLRSTKALPLQYYDERVMTPRIKDPRFPIVNNKTFATAAYYFHLFFMVEHMGEHNFWVSIKYKYESTSLKRI
jgi:hypothetical protein